MVIIRETMDKPPLLLCSKRVPIEEDALGNKDKVGSQPMIIREIMDKAAMVNMVAIVLIL